MGWILLLLILFVAWPLIRVAWAVHRTRSRLRRAYEEAYEQAYGTPPPGSRRRRTRRQDPTPPRRGKIIAKDVGEYVDFEEVSSYNPESSSSTETTRTSFKAESQIEDAEWEEIKE